MNTRLDPILGKLVVDSIRLPSKVEKQKLQYLGRSFVNAGAPDETFDENAAVTVEGVIGYRQYDVIYDTSVSPADIYRCISAAAGEAVWVDISLTTAEVQAYVDGVLYQKIGDVDLGTLTGTTSITPDLANGVAFVATVDALADITVNAPANSRDGAVIMFKFTNPGAASAWAWDPVYKFAGGEPDWTAEGIDTVTMRKWPDGNYYENGLGCQ